MQKHKRAAGRSRPRESGEAIGASGVSLSFGFQVLDSISHHGLALSGSITAAAVMEPARLIAFRDFVNLLVYGVFHKALADNQLQIKMTT